jgi:hypothetical protein
MKTPFFYGEFTQYSRSQIRTWRPKNLADRREKEARTDRSPIGFLAEKDLRVAAIWFELVRLHFGKVGEASEREAQTEPRRHKVVLRLIYKIIPEV